MDALDRKILNLLRQNSRRPSSEIAKKLKKSRQVIDYRISQLVKKNIISKMYALIDSSFLYKDMWHVYLKLQNLTPEIEEEITTYLIEQKQSWWVVKCQGEWDIIFSVLGEKLLDIDDFMMDFKSRFSKNISSQEITSFIKGYVYYPSYLDENSRASKEKIYGLGDKDYGLDDIDLGILKMLVNDARAKSTHIARSLRVSPRQVIYRTKKLEREGVINSYMLEPNLVKLGYDYYKVCFYTQNFTKKTEESIKQWCLRNPNILFFVKKLGPWTFEIELEIESYRRLNELLKEMRSEFGDVIKRVEITLMSQVFKGEMNPLILQD